VPSLYISPFADSLGYCRLLKQYGLLTSVKSEEEGLIKIEELLSNPNLKARKKSKEKLLNETIDLVDFITKKCETATK
jgi:predicted glycosyltransferase